MKKYVLTTVLIIYCAMGNAQIITTIAGNGTPVYSGAGDGSPATAVGTTVQGIAIDSLGNVYIADGVYRIRKVDTAGIISTVAGGGTGLGDGGPATAAEVDQPYGICVDNNGNMYITVTYAVRKVDRSGIISLFAGKYVSGGGYSGDGGAATAATMERPIAVTYNTSGTVYMADNVDAVVRQVSPVGIINNFAGRGGMVPGDGGPATAATLVPYDIAADHLGHIYIADGNNHRIRMVSTAGIITTIAGNGSGAGGVGTFSGDGGPATAAGLYFPTGIAVDALGNIYISDADNSRIRKVNRAGIISNIVGSGPTGYSGGGFSGDGGPATAAMIYHPGAIRLDCGGNLYIADAGNNRVRKVTYNHAPYFSGGHTQGFTACDTGANDINELLAAFDIDTLQVATWSSLQLPAHGTLSAAYTTTTTGATLTPSGLSYRPMAGYVGTDTFRMVVADCGHLLDTTTIYVTVKACNAGITSTSAAAGLLAVYPNPNTGTCTINMQTPLTEQVTVHITNLLGTEVEQLTIMTNTAKELQLHEPAGVYFLSVTTSAGRYVSRIMVNP